MEKWRCDIHKSSWLIIKMWMFPNKEFLILLVKWRHSRYPWPEILACENFDWYTERDPSDPQGLSKVCAGDPDYTKDKFAVRFPDVLNGTYYNYNVDVSVNFCFWGFWGLHISWYIINIRKLGKLSDYWKNFNFSGNRFPSGL